MISVVIVRGIFVKKGGYQCPQEFSYVIEIESHAERFVGLFSICSFELVILLFVCILRKCASGFC